MTTDESASPIKLIDKIPAIISLIGGLSLIISVIYNWGYFVNLGLSYKEIPATLTDHARDTIIWLPKISLLFFGVFVGELINNRIEQGMTEEEIINSSSNPKLIRIFRNSPAIPIVGIALIVPILYFTRVDIPLQAYQFSFIILWFMLHNWLFGHERIIERTSSLFRVLSRWMPAFVIFFGFQGSIGAKKDIEYTKTITVINLSNGTRVSGNQLRSFDKSILLKAIDKNEYFIIPWSAVIDIKLSQPTKKI